MFNLEGKNFDRIKYMIQHSDNEILLENDSLGEYYLELLKLRHNILHFAVFQYIGQEWQEEQTVRRFLNLEDSHKLLDKTPDIQLVEENHYIMIDVSISYDFHSSEQNKKEKYEPVLIYLKKYNYISEFIHINIKVTRKNLFKELEKISNLRQMDFPIHDFETCMELVENKFNVIRENIDKVYFEKLKLDQFGDTIEQMGYSKDLDIDLNEFKLYNSKYSLEDNILKSYENQMTEDELCVFLKEQLENEGNIYRKFVDKKCTAEAFELAYEKNQTRNETMERCKIKPSHHIIFPFNEKLKINESKIEQDQIISFLKNIITNKFKLEDEMEKFILEISEICVEMFDEKNPNKDFNKDIFFDFFRKKETSNAMTLFKKFNKLKILLSLDEKELDNATKRYFAITKENYKDVKNFANIEFKELSKKYKYKSGNYAFKDFLVDNDIVNSTKEWFETYAFRNKCIITELDKRTENFKRVYKKTGISHKFNKDDLKKNFEETIDMSNSINTDFFLKNLVKPSYKYKEKNRHKEYLKCSSEIDDSYSKNFKSELNENIIPKFEYLAGTKSFEYLDKIRLISNQLIHFTTLEMKPGSFSLFTCGIPNFLCVVAGCYNKLFSQLGKPFLCCFITENPDQYTSFFGKLKKTRLYDDVYLVTTNWRRLPTFKLLHMKDLYYSVVSSTMNSLLSYSTEFAPLENDRIRKQFALRTMIGCATNQKCAEFLVDVRYAYVSSYAKYTNIEKLLIEKFSPPYKTSIETWIIKRLYTRLPLIHQSKQNINLNTADYFGGKRTMNSMGVNFKMPSLWFDYDLKEITEFLDEAFCYVHTLKEPSNIYYENVKAINTIMEFQEKYDSLSENRQQGILFKENIEEFLLSDNKIGCYSRCIIDSANLMYNTDNPDFRKIVDGINNEDIGEIVSTKAVISDNERKIKPVEEFSKRQMEKRILKAQFYKSKASIDDLSQKYVIDSKSQYYNNRKPRQKVFETTLNLIENNEEINRTVDLANFFIKNEKGKVNADICIKAQYGSKREFYVINIGAKALARCTENFFKKICETNRHEAISIPGDYKMLEMQKMIDRVYTSDKLMPTSKLIYVNGDCTKWSAAETMASFVSLIIPLKNRIPENMYQLLLSTYNSWSDKNIQIPLDIINNFIIPGDKEKNTKKYDFIRKSILENNGKFKSTQNFLQGMYNYASSYKAVCCSNYTFYIWKKIYPRSTLFLEHMEHSDDYVLCVMTESFKEFEKFRVLHKIMMRFHGFNDSDKKTNCQTFMMEFVSLISFNGVMLYPQIKKTKEVNTNLPCTGFKSDIEASFSRVGEAMRMGCNQTFLYFMSKWQNICVAEVYSLLPGMSNSYTTEYTDMLDTPVELFGLIDMLPIFSLYCKGNGNNYRLYTYGDEKTKKKIKYLLLKAQEYQHNENVLVENTDYMYSLFNPKFIYERSNSSIVKLRRKMNWFPEDLLNFWKENSSYKLMKPRQRVKLIKWLKSMFYNRTFTEAYSKSSRTKMTMRISHFIRNPVVALKIDPARFKEKYPEKNSTLMTMAQYINYCNEDIENYEYPWDEKNENSLIRIITKCDPTFGAIYEYLKNIKILERIANRKTNRAQISIKTPDKITSVDIVNSPSAIIQFMYNYNDFILDKRRIVSEYSLLRDVEIIQETFLDEIKEEVGTMELLSLYNNLTILKEKNIICIGFSRKSETLKDQIGDIFRYNFLPFANCDINFSDVIHIKDPVSGKILYTRGGKITPTIIQQSLENLALIHSYMTLKQFKSLKERKEILEKIIFKDPINKNEYGYTEILEMVTMNNIKTFKLNLHTRKILGYFKALYLGENDVLNDIITNYYSYSYKYETIAKRIGDSYFGETFGTFKHLENLVSFNTLDKNNKKVILLADTINYQMINLHYNIALRLTYNLTENNFQKNPTKIKMPQIKLFKTKNEALEYFDKNDVRGIYLNKNNKMTFERPENYNPDLEYFPFLKVGKLYKMKKEKRGTLRPSYFKIDDKKMMIFLGSYKLFTLPILACKQFDNMRYIGTEKIYAELLRQNNLHNYFHRRELNIYGKKPFKLDENKIQYEIERQKIYDFYTSEMIEYVLKNKTKNFSHLFTADSSVITHFIEQGLIKKKSEKDEFKIKDAKGIQDFVNFFDDDFLVLEEDLGFDLDDDSEIANMPSTKDLNFMDFYDLETDFLIKPNTTKKTLKQNFILAKLKSLPIFELQFNRNIYLKNVDTRKMNLYELVENLKICFSNLSQLNDSLIWYDIYELLCNTYVKLHAKKTIHQYHIKGKKITFTTNITSPNDPEILQTITEKLTIKNSVQNFKILGDFFNFDIVYNVETAMAKFSQNCGTKIKTFRKNIYQIKTYQSNKFDVLSLLNSL